MSHDANQSKELAKQELARFESVVSEERKLREKELAERRALVSKKQEVNAELERRERSRREAMAAPHHAASDEVGRGARGGGGAQHVITEADIEEEREKIASWRRLYLLLMPVSVSMNPPVIRWLSWITAVRPAP